MTNFPRKVIILGAAGRDFHNFNLAYRHDPAVRVVAFTAAQIEGIAGRRYPPVLAGPLYPEGIPIHPEAELEALCDEHAVDEVIFAYSDVTHECVMHLASRALAAGASFSLLGPRETMLCAQVPVIAACAVRTGCGKSQVSRWLSRRLRDRGLRVGVIRHPMPYGDLAAQAVQRFATAADLDAANCTVEEREEYEPHIAIGNTVWAGVDYEHIVAQAAADADVLLWDGGNNDFPFVRPDLLITLADALRPGHESRYHPGEAVLRMANVVVLTKSDAAAVEDVTALAASVRTLNPCATIIRGASPVTLDDPAAVKGKRVLVVEDGPTITHGGMPGGAGYAAAIQAGAEVIDPRPWAAGPMAEVFARFPHIGPVIPAMGYSPDQLAALRDTLNAAPADAVASATPADIGSLVALNKPVVRVRYEYADMEVPGLAAVMEGFIGRFAQR